VAASKPVGESVWVDNGCKLICQWTMPAEPGMLAAIHPPIPQTARHSLAVSISSRWASVSQSVSEADHADLWPNWLIGHLMFLHIPFWRKIGIILCTSIRFMIFFHNCSQGDFHALSFWSVFCADLNFYMCNSIHCIIIILMQRSILLWSSLSLVRSSC